MSLNADQTALPLLANKSYNRQHKPALTEIERLRIENRELKRALVALDVVKSLHPDQAGSVPSRKSKGQIHQSNKGVVKKAGALHATADEWMAMIEDRIKEQKKGEAEERAVLHKDKRAKKMQEKEATRQCCAVFKSGKRNGQQCTVMCLYPML